MLVNSHTGMKMKFARVILCSTIIQNGIATKLQNCIIPIHP
jgi:hypothetical protein